MIMRSRSYSMDMIYTEKIDMNKLGLIINLIIFQFQKWASDFIIKVEVIY